MRSKVLLKLFLLFLTGFNLIAAPGLVKLSDFKPQRQDATEAFKAAINSGAKKVIIDNPGFALQLTPIRLRSNLELVFEDGVIAEAKKNEFKGIADFWFYASGCSNIIIRGKGKVILRMHKKDYKNKKLYKSSEWRHLFAFKGCSNVQIKNLSLLSSGGDGVYLGTTNKMPYCKDVVLEDLVISDHHRQGISVISAENLIVRRCVIKDTTGIVGAGAGIDFEPNTKPAGQRLVNCLVEDCTISGNCSTGIGFYTVKMENGAPFQTITIRNCLFKNNNKAGTGIYSSYHRKGREKIAPPTGAYKFENCKFIKNNGLAIFIIDQIPTVKISFKNCLLEVGNNKKDIPIQLTAWKMRQAPIGGLTFENVIIDKLPAGRKVMTFKSWSASSVTDIKGDIFIKTASGKKRFPLEQYVAKLQKQVADRNKTGFVPKIANWRKFTCSKLQQPKYKDKLPGITNNGHFMYIFWAKKMDNVKLTAVQGNPHPWRSKKFEIIAPNGKKIFKTELNKKNTTANISFVAPVTGCYRIYGSSRKTTLRITCNKPGGWCYHRNRSLRITGKLNKLFFAVPKGVKDFELAVHGDMSSPFIKATVRNARGKIIASNNSIETPYRFRLKRNDTARRIWSLEIKMASPTERAYVRQGKSLEGLFADSPNSILGCK